LKIVISAKAKTAKFEETGSEQTWMPYHVVNGTFEPDRGWKPGDILKLHDLAGTLENIAKQVPGVLGQSVYGRFFQVS
jgi:hypothetical protein